MGIKVVQQKTFMTATIQEMDLVCNQFRLDHPKFIWKGTTINTLEGATIVGFIATIFWEEYV